MLYVMGIELVTSLAGIGGGRGGYWEETTATNGTPASSPVIF